MNVRRWVVATALVVFGLAVGSGVAGTSASASVPLTPVSSDPYVNPTSLHATEVEPDTFAVGATLVSAFQAGRFEDGGASNIGWSTSTSRGARYAHGFLPGTTGTRVPGGHFARMTDPSVAYDAKHKVWLINSLALTASGGNVRGAAILVNRSRNGLTWGNPRTVLTATGTQDFDKNWMVCDNTATSPHYGNCYAEWDDFGGGNQLHMAFSTDGGLTWTQSTVPSSSVIGGQPVVQPSGTVIMPINNGAESVVESFVSTNGGATYGGPFTVATATSHLDAGGIRAPNLPSAEVDKAGRVYAAWADCRFISGCSANDIVFSTSTDGIHWSAVSRVPINPAGSGTDHFLPGLAVDQRTSGAATKLALTYYFYPATNCTTATCQLEVGVVRSADAGAHWTAPIQLAGPSKLDQLAQTTQGRMVGDYLSTSFITGGSSDAALSVFAIGKAVAGHTCTLGQVASCNEPMEAPTSPLSAGSAAIRSTVTGPVMSRRSDHAANRRLTAR